MSLFGNGLSAAVALRVRILERLGATDAAEEPWATSSPDLDLVAWMSGPVATFFRVDHGGESTPDLGTLKVLTPVAVVENREVAQCHCDRLNREQATASRWIISDDGLGTQTLGATCTFVVGPHNVEALTGFALWCVREQIAAAAETAGEGIPGLVSSAADDDADVLPYGWGPYPELPRRDDEHEVTRHYERYIDPGRDAWTGPLTEALRVAFGALRAQMRCEGAGVWGAREDAPLLAFETPMTWDSYPDGFIGRFEEDGPPTAIVNATLDDHPRAGNGLRISMRVPYQPVPDALAALSRMNLLDAGVPGATCTIGAWSLEKCPVVSGDDDEDERTAGGNPVQEAGPGYVYSVYLPASLANPGLAGPDIDLPAIMREVLLTMARQALLFRRMLHPGLRAWEDEQDGMGLTVRATRAHGLAWGETMEGRNPGALMLDRLYAGCVGDDRDRADTRPDGFTWWPYQQAQTVTLIPNAPPDSPPSQILRVATEIRTNVPRTRETLTVIAELNARLARSVLLLSAEGTLTLACHLDLADEGPWLGTWARALVVDQYSTARDLLTRLDELPGQCFPGQCFPRQGFPGRAAISAHPFTGPRPDEGELFGIREALYVPRADRARPALTTLVALLATVGQAFPPHRVRVRDDGGIDFTWHPSQGGIGLVTDWGADPAIRVSAWPGDTGAGPGWVVRSHLPITGGLAARARWCDEANAELVDGPDTASLHVIGGWGLTPEGDCCLTTWLPPFLVPGESGQVRRLLDGLRDHQAAVITALLDSDPAEVVSEPLTPGELGAGLEEALGAFGKILEHPAGYRWIVDQRDVGVVVSLSGSAEVDIAANSIAANSIAANSGAELAEAGGAEFRTVLQIPATGNRTELGLIYAAFLGRSETRVGTRAPYDLVPGELTGWHFTGEQIDCMIGQLAGEGLLDWPDGDTSGRFTAGPVTATLRIVHLDPDRLYDAAPLRILAIVDGVTLPPVPERDARDTDVLGTWRDRGDGIAYQVTIPPAGLVWGSDRTAADTLTWVVRHVIRHVRAAFG
ncbi:MAG TPA: hypothetical protein VGG75_21675 [Trebonia sp.]